MALDWKPFVDIVHQHQRFLLTTHVRPDGDGIGSLVALREALLHLGKQVQLVISSVFPVRYRFLDPDQVIQQFTPPGDAFRANDAAIVLDTGTWNQLADFGPFLRQLPVTKVVIDHHLTQDDLQSTRFVDTKAEATGRLVFEAITALGVPLGPTTANALFVALAMDTGWFRHTNTNAATFALAERLAQAGAQPTTVYDLLFEQSTLPRMKLIGLILERMTLCGNNRIAYTEIHRSDYSATGATPQDSEDLVNFTRSIGDVEVGLLFMEQPRGGVKISFRSRSKVDVARLAEHFGGGGHRLASGAIVDAPLEEVRTRVLTAALAALESAC